MADKLEGFIMYNCWLENHIKYSEKLTLKDGPQGYPHHIWFDHDYIDHHHYIHACQHNLDSIPYGWPLTTIPFMGPCPSPLIANSMNLTPFTCTYPFFQEVNIALYTINDHSLITDVDMHQELEEEERQIAHHRRELDNDTLHLEHKLGPICQHLHEAQAYPHVHPYLMREAKVPCPHSHNPTLYHNYPLTMEQAMGLSTMGQVHWLPCPWYHDKDQPGNNSSFSLHHNLCVYCNDPDHSTINCPSPHHLCNDRLCCIIPSYHKNFGSHCPANSCCHLINTMLNHYHSGLMEDRDANPGFNDGEAWCLEASA